MTRRWPLLLWFALLLPVLAAARADAAASAVASARVEPTGPLRPGDRATLVVTVEVNAGLHAQSHTPSSKDYIPLTVDLDPSPVAAFGPVDYPPGKDEVYLNLGQLNVYVDSNQFRVPVTISAGAANGPAELHGSVHLQACNDEACFQPEDEAFTVGLTVTGGSSAARPTVQPVTRPTAAAPPPPAADGPTLFGFDLNRGGLPIALLGAFVVGILFNAMPCVLPVIPLKVMGFYEVSKHSRGKCLGLGAVFGAGLVSVFALLALLIVGLHVIDWGGLFQQTWFTVLITVVLVAMAAGTLGVFNVGLPTGIYNLTPKHDTYTGNFLFGMLTAALSTPCTFGLFVALLTWTLTRPAVEGFAVFVTVGLGMAFPYLVLSAFPELARRFPRTGPWGGVVKVLMGFLLLATAVFFAQPLIGAVVSIDATWWLMFAVIAAGMVYLVVKAARISTSRTGVIVAAAVALAVVVPALIGTRYFTSHPYQWEPYTPAALARATAAGHPVVIDFTATWCGNCHWLEGTVLHDRTVVTAIRRHDVVMMKADVTHGDAVGQPLLNELNPTHAIPLTAVYAPHAGDAKPAVLDGIYSAADLVNTIQRATGG